MRRESRPSVPASTHQESLGIRDGCEDARTQKQQRWSIMKHNNCLAFCWNISHWLQFSKTCQTWAHFQFCDWLQCRFHMTLMHQKAICVNTIHGGFQFEEAQRWVSSFQTDRQNAVECNSMHFYHNLTSHHKKVQKKDASRLCSPEVLTSWGPPGGHKSVLGGLWPCLTS